MALSQEFSKSRRVCGSMFNWVFKMGHSIQSWFLYYLAFTKSVLFITGLVFSHSVVEYSVVVVFMSYLMAEWKEDLQKSAITVNINQGLTSVFTLVCAHLADTYIGNFKMIIISTAAYIIGLGLLCLSSMKVFPHTQVCFFYMAVAMISIGKAGRNSALKPFLANQFKAKCQDEDDVRVESRTKVWWGFAWFMGIIVATFIILPCALHWPRSFKQSTYLMALAFVLFLRGISFYHFPTTTTRSPLTVVYRVLKVATQHRHLDQHINTNQYYERNQSFTLPHSGHLRWLDKAAIIIEVIEVSSDNPEEARRSGRLCTVTQVEETKLLLGMMPIWMTFLVYSLVKSTGENFFIEQATNTNGCEYKILFLCFVKSFVSVAVSCLYESTLAKLGEEYRRTNATLVKIGLGMVSSLFCSSVAWWIEARRLSLVTNYGSPNGLMNSKPMLSMGIEWFVPQFCFLGLMEGLAEDGIKELVCLQVSRRMKGYGSILTRSVIGVGNLLSALSIFASRRWFNGNLNNSRLDKYYQMLTVWSYVNLLFYWYVSKIYTCKNNIEGQVEAKINIGSAS